MAHPRILTEKGAELAAAENEKTVHELKDEYDCGRALYNMGVDTDDNTIVLVPVDRNNPSGDIRTDYKTSVRLWQWCLNVPTVSVGIFVFFL